MKVPLENHTCYGSAAGGEAILPEVLKTVFVVGLGAAILGLPYRQPPEEEGARQIPIPVEAPSLQPAVLDRAAAQLVDQIERMLENEPGIFETMCAMASRGEMRFGATATDWAVDASGKSG